MASLFRESFARVQGFLLTPAPAEPATSGIYARTEVVVFGLSAGCGVTTLARALALLLHVPGERPSQLLTIGNDGDRSLEETFLAGRPSVLVWDVASGDAASARGMAHRADAVVLVAGPDTEPPLAELAARMLREDLGRVLLVANRVTDAARWTGRADLCVPESRFAAALIGRGWRPSGAIAPALAQLADLVEQR